MSTPDLTHKVDTLTNEVAQLKAENAELKRLVELLLTHANLPADVKSQAVFNVPAASATSTPSPSSTTKQLETSPPAYTPAPTSTGSQQWKSGAASQATTVPPAASSAKWNTASFNSNTTANSSTSSTYAPRPQPTQPPPAAPSTSSTFASRVQPSQPPPPLPGSASAPPASSVTSSGAVPGTLTAAKMNIALTPVQHQAQQNGFSIYGTTYSQEALDDLIALANNKNPKFTSITLFQLFQWCKLHKDKDLTKRTDTFYARVQGVLRFLDIDLNNPILNNINIPLSYFPLDLYNNAQKSKLHISPIEYYRFLVCVQHNLPYYDNNDVLYNLFQYLGIPLFLPINFHNSLQNTKYILSHCGYYKQDRKTNTTFTIDASPMVLIYISNTSDLDSTFWLHLIRNTLTLHNVLLTPYTSIYHDSYLAMPYFYNILSTIEVFSMLASCYNLINMNDNTRSTANLFAHFFIANHLQKEPMDLTELYEFIWYISYVIFQVASSASVHFIQSTNSAHWLLKVFGHSTVQCEFAIRTLTSLLLSNELFYICYNTPNPSAELMSQIRTRTNSYKVQVTKVIAKKELSKTDQMMINNIKLKLSTPLRDFFNVNTSSQLVNNAANSTQGNMKWLGEMLDLVKNL